MISPQHCLFRPAERVLSQYLVELERLLFHDEVGQSPVFNSLAALLPGAVPGNIDMYGIAEDLDKHGAEGKFGRIETLFHVGDTRITITRRIAFNDGAII